MGGSFLPTRRRDPEALPSAPPLSLVNDGGVAGGQAIFPLADSHGMWLVALRRETFALQGWPRYGLREGEVPDLAEGDALRTRAVLSWQPSEKTGPRSPRDAGAPQMHGGLS